MSWQIGNEPRAFKKELLPDFERWVGKTAALIRSLDANHLISLGSEGLWGCEMDINSWARMCADSNVDYCNVHLWPYNWGWASKDRLHKDLEQAEANTKAYIDSHLHICDSIGKPLVMEEFGYPRDNFSFVPGSPTTARDAYYRYVFTLVTDNAKAGGKFAGCNFWAWGGSSVEGWTPRQILETYKDIDIPKELKRGWNGKWWEYYTPLSQPSLYSLGVIPASFLKKREKC